MTSAIIGMMVCLGMAGCRSTNLLTASETDRIANRSAYTGPMTKTQALEIVEKVLRNTYQDSVPEVYSFHVTETQAEVRVKLYSDSQTIYRIHLGRKYVREKPVGEKVALALPWSDISGIEAINSNVRIIGSSGVTSLMVHYNTADTKGNSRPNSVKLNLFSQNGLIALSGKPIVKPADVILALEVLMGKQPDAKESPPISPPADKPSDRETKLKELKNLFDSGLISGAVYEEKQKELLNSL